MTSVLHLTYDAGRGGAGRAAQRIHAAVLGTGVASVLRAARTDRNPSATVATAWSTRFRYGMRARTEAAINALMSTPNAAPRWTAAVPSAWSTMINSCPCDIVHLHWVCGGMMSIEDIGRIRKPIVWTMHDMWPFCGAENIAADERYVAGYTPRTRPAQERGIDLNAWTWQRKQRAWRTRFQIVAPSRWMGSCVSRSALMAEWPVAVVPNPIDTRSWSPRPRDDVRRGLGIAHDERVLCVAGIDGALSPHKGYDLFTEALPHVARTTPVTVLVIGHSGSWRPRLAGVSFRFLGALHDDAALADAFCAADAMIVPSRIDNLPNTAVEAASCGVPVVAFDIGGLADIVTHGVSGYLARPFDTADLATGIDWVLARAAAGDVGRAARQVAEQRFAMSRVGEQYRAVYHSVLSRA
jgi:glycosyltransferase involved in cell wall biosynthesis